jgi:type II secretory pathway component GspD/PulD (secretin)
MRFFWFAALSVLAIAGSLLSGPVIAHAQGGEKIKVEAGSAKGFFRVVSIEDSDVRLSLRRLMAAVAVSYSVAPEVQGTVTVELRNIDLETALQYILKQVDATYRVEGGVYQIVPLRQEESPGLRDPSVRVAQKPIRIEMGSSNLSLRVVKMDRADFKEAVERLFQVVDGPGYSISPDVQGTVTLEMKDVPFETVLQSLCKQVDATYRADGGTYRIVRKQAPPDEHAIDRPMLVTMEFRDQPFEIGLRRLLDSGLNYRIEAGNYYLLDRTGQPMAQIQSSVRPTAGVPPVISQDGGFLYILRGNSLVKVSKKDLKVISRMTLPD